MSKRPYWILAIFGLYACEPLEVGEPPTFSGISNTAVISESQVELRWNPGEDPEGLLDPEELSYGIWYVEQGGQPNLDQAPNVLTGEGAMSYNLLDLEAGKSYSVIVRARDRGTNYSTNETLTTVTMPAANQGRFKKAVTFDLGQTPGPMFAGQVFGSGRDDLCVVLGADIRFYQSGTNGNLNPVQRRVSLDETIVSACLVPVRPSALVEDLLVLTQNGLFYLPNTDGDFEQLLTPFDGIGPFRNPVAGITNGIMDVWAYADSQGRAYFYTLDDDEDFQRENTANLPNQADIFGLARLDGDNRYDLVSFGSTGLRLALGSNNQFGFGTATVIDAEGTGSDTPHLFLVDGDGDGDEDIYLFLRNTAADKTLMRVYENQGGGSFGTKQEQNYNAAFYEHPSFQLANADDLSDFVVPQASANNVALYQSSVNALAFSAVTNYFGGFGKPDYATFGNFDGRNSRDLAILSASDRKITVLFANPGGL